MGLVKLTWKYFTKYYLGESVCHTGFAANLGHKLVSHLTILIRYELNG